MFRATKDVTETRESEPKPDKIIQDTRSATVGGAALSVRFVAIDVGSLVDSPALRIATTAQMITKTTNPADQSLACVVVVSFRSRRKGYVKCRIRQRK